MNVFPLAITTVDWQQYSAFVKEILNIDPLKGLGESYIKIDSPVAYLATLDLENQPKKHLRTCSYSFMHFSVSFISKITPELLFEIITTFPNLKVLSKPTPLGQYLSIISSDMFIWTETVSSALLETNPISDELRKFFNLILIHFDNMGFREVWSKYERKFSNGLIYFQKRR